MFTLEYCSRPTNLSPAKRRTRRRAGAYMIDYKTRFSFLMSCQMKSRHSQWKMKWFRAVVQTTKLCCVSYAGRCDGIWLAPAGSSSTKPTTNSTHCFIQTYSTCMLCRHGGEYSYRHSVIPTLHGRTTNSTDQLRTYNCVLSWPSAGCEWTVSSRPGWMCSWAHYEIEEGKACFSYDFP